MLDHLLGSVQPSVLRDQVAAALRSAILTGTLKPGTRLVEMDLAASMNVSKAPVREAMRLLEAEGLVTTIPHKGNSVTRLSAEDLRDIYGLRSAIERLAVGYLMDRHDHDILDRLRTSVEEMKAAEESGDSGRQTDVDLRFHHLIVTGSNSQRIVRLWTDMHGLIRMLVAEGDSLGDLSGGGASKHMSILEAIEAGDKDAAQSLLERHILDASTGVLANLERGRNASS